MKRKVILVVVILLIVSTSVFASPELGQAVPSPVPTLFEERLQQQIIDFRMEIIYLQQQIMKLEWRLADIDIKYQLPLGKYIVIDQFHRAWMQCASLLRIQEFDLPKELKGQDLVPLRPLLEALNMKIEWKNDKRIIVINPFTEKMITVEAIIGSNGRAYLPPDLAQSIVSFLVGDGTSYIIHVPDPDLTIIKIEALG